MNIDWSKAPEGATHFHPQDTMRPWRMLVDDTAFAWSTWCQFRGPRWVRITMPIVFDELVPRSSRKFEIDEEDV